MSKLSIGAGAPHSALDLVESPLPIGRGRLEVLSSLLSRYAPGDAASETLLARKIRGLQVTGEVSAYEARALDRLGELVELRALVFGRAGKGKHALRQGFAFAAVPVRVASEASESVDSPPSPQDVMESATLVAELYWKLYRTCGGEFPELQKVALRLYEAIFHERFAEAPASARIAKLTDAMQRHHGLPFLMLNLLRQGRECSAREVSQVLLVGQAGLEEDVRSALYWTGELYLFTGKNALALSDHESTMRHLYHLCFTNPDRAGILEIDSPFYGELEVVNETAREALVFRETLVDWMLTLWQEYEGLFDSIFRHVLRAVAPSPTKIHETQVTFASYWERERETFLRDYLFVVEGNLAYAAGDFAAAAECFRQALALNPALRAARLNQLFCSAGLGDATALAEQAEAVTADKSLLPAALSVAGNAFLLLGVEEESNRYYDRLARIPGWEHRVDYYRSTFAFAHKKYDLALRFACLAYGRNPYDRNVQFHLSLCHNAVGDTEKALETLADLQSQPGQEWMEYYRFTLERDAGRHDEASRTLFRVPISYFDDPEELEDALRFARNRQDLGLLRHLKRK